MILTNSLDRPNSSAVKAVSGLIAPFARKVLMISLILPPPMIGYHRFIIIIIVNHRFINSNIRQEWERDNIDDGVD
jgi:hypothetical protein